jgi:hypothetical protein
VCWLLYSTGQCYIFSVVCCVRTISPSEMKIFIYTIIVMAYVFHLFYVVIVVCNGGSCFYSESIQCFKCVVWVWDCPCGIILVELQNLFHDILTLKCVFILTMSATRKYFKLLFPRLFEGPNMNHYVHNTLFFCNSLFPMWHFFPYFSS